MSVNFEANAGYKRVTGVTDLGVPADDPVTTIALSAGFGDAATIEIATGSTALRGSAVITSAGTGQGANPTATLTIPAPPYQAAPVVVTSRTTGDQPLVPINVSSTTASTIVFKLAGSAVDGEDYGFSWICFG